MYNSEDVWRKGLEQVAEDADGLRGLLSELRAHALVKGWHPAIDRWMPALSRLAAGAQLAQARGEAFNAALANADVSAASWAKGHDTGAEAMRAACLLVAENECWKVGVSPHQWSAIKAAIEGATP